MFLLYGMKVAGRNITMKKKYLVERAHLIENVHYGDGNYGNKEYSEINSIFLKHNFPFLW